MKNLIIIIFALVSVNSTFSQIGWNRLSIQTNENFNEIDFVNDSIGFVCGEKGVLFKTVDAGLNWQLLNTPDTFTINSVAFTDEMNGGILYGENNPMFFVTTDGGISWQQKASGNGGFCFPQVIFAVEDKILIGGHGCFYGDAIAVYQNDSIIMDTMLGNVNVINNFDFIDDKIGFASSTLSTSFIAYSRIYKTIDGGLSWILIPNSDSLLSMYDIAFEDENIGYCVSLDTAINGSGTPAVLFKTNDGGNTWNDVIGQLFVTPTFTDIDIYAKDSVIAVGSYVNQFSNNGAVWLNFLDTFPLWFSEDFKIDSLNPRLMKNDVVENNGCLYVIGNNGFIAKTCKDSIVLLPSYIENIEIKIQFNLFPNPSKGIFTFEYDNKLSSFFNIQVFDVVGKEIYHIKIEKANSNKKTQLDLSFLENGNYYFVIVENNKKHTYKFTILE